jgi:hypothetical protein
MKTRTLLTAALFLSTASFAQSVATKNEEASSAIVQSSPSGKTTKANLNSSSDITVKTSAPDKTAGKADHAIQQTKKTVVAQKEQVTARTEADIESGKKTVSSNSSGSAYAHAENQDAAESRNNKVSQESYLNNQAAVSAEGAKSSRKEAEKDGQATLKKQTASTVQTTDHVEKQSKSSLIKTSADAKTTANSANGKAKTDVKVGSASAMKAGTSIANTSKPKPASFKMQTQIKSNARLKIK